jgi:UDPglucose--hexose-1-phosphate uridylyltransferase
MFEFVGLRWFLAAQASDGREGQSMNTPRGARRTDTRLSDGRELIYYDPADAPARVPLEDTRGLPAPQPQVELRTDPLTGDVITYATHRNTRTYLPPADQCPLCASKPGNPTEIPDHDYNVAVFENRFPSFAGPGRTEVVCFTSDHNRSFTDLSQGQARLVVDTWADRTAELGARDDVELVFPFENRGREIGVTLSHPHGQIYAYPFTTPRTALMLRQVAAHKEATGGENLFDAVLRSELAGERVVLEGEHWVAFVPYAAHWPYEVHLYPKRRVPDLLGLDEDARTEFPKVYLELLRRFDRIFGENQPLTPYISGWHQAPFGALEEFEGVNRDDFALHLELFTIRRTSGKLKFLAGSESGMNVFINDVPPEHAAERLREVAS